MSNISFNNDHFSSLSGSYDSRSALANNGKLRNYLKSIVTEIKNKKIVDLGVGTGTFASLFRDRNQFIIGVDLNASMLKTAMKKNINPVLSNACNTPFQNHAFDIVLCRQIIQYLTRDMFCDLIRESYRLIKPGGSLLIHNMVPMNRQHSYYLKNFMKINTNKIPYLLSSDIVTTAIEVGYHVAKHEEKMFQCNETILQFCRYRNIDIFNFNKRIETYLKRLF